MRHESNDAENNETSKQWSATVDARNYDRVSVRCKLLIRTFHIN